MKPTFSIVINTDGRRDSLATTLRSLRFLDYPSFEVCAVYGPTIDGTKELLESYEGRIKIGHCPERNISMSRNIGIGMAAGEYVAFIDDDALPEPEWLRDLARGYDCEEVGGTGGQVYDHTGWELQYGYSVADRLGNSVWDLTRPADEFNFSLSDKFPYLQGTNASFRRSVLSEIGGFDEEIEFYLDETDVCCRLIDAGYAIRQLPNAFVHHKFLPSHIRNVHRVTKNRYPVLKNKIYFSIINNHGHHGIGEVIEDARRFISQHADDLMMHANAGRLSADDVSQFWVDVDRAWRRGLARGLSGERMLSSRAREIALYEPFLEFRGDPPAGGRKVFCFLSQEYPPGRIGGIGTYTESAAGELAKMGHHVHVLTQSAAGNTIDFEDDVWVHRLEIKDMEPKPPIELGVPRHIWNYSGTLREELYRIAGRRPITAVEAPIWDVEGIAVLYDGYFPTVLSLHTTLGIWLETHESYARDLTYMTDFGLPMLALEKYMLVNSTGVHANSDAIVKELDAYYQITLDRPRTRVIHHGIRDPAALPRSSLPRDRSQIHILFVGRLERRKGIDIAIEAVSALLARGRAISCDIVGDDTVPWDGTNTYRQAFAGSLTVPALSRSVQFHGKVSGEDLRGFFAGADIVVVPSRFESFGLTVIEAFAFGKAVVAASAGGIAEIVEDGHAGILVSPDDARGLADALDRLIADGGLRAKLGRAARSGFERRFSSARMAQDLAGFLSGFERSVVPRSDLALYGDIEVGVPLRNHETGILLSSGARIEIEAAGSSIYMTFWCHAWSGIVHLRHGGDVLARWDLYSELARFATMAVHDVPIGALLAIEATGEQSEGAEGCEVIYYGASFLTQSMRRRGARATVRRQSRIGEDVAPL
ncbi:MAG: glycosyltransferase [Alphaproteobacteria bacterium]|nr:glycosyltransferase [Alphaproteobacteria bacterium]